MAFRVLWTEITTWDNIHRDRVYILWVYCTVKGKSTHRLPTSRQVYREARYTHAQQRLLDSWIRQATSAIEKGKHVWQKVEKLRSLYMPSTWKHRMFDKISLALRETVWNFREDKNEELKENTCLGIITSFLELSCDVELTLHFCFHNKNDLLFYSDDAIRIQLWKQMKRHHSPSS